MEKIMVTLPLRIATDSTFYEYEEHIATESKHAFPAVHFIDVSTHSDIYRRIKLSGG